MKTASLWQARQPVYADVDRALAALRAVARGTARIIGERGNRSRAGAAVKGRCRPSVGGQILGPGIDPAGGGEETTYLGAV